MIELYTHTTPNGQKPAILLEELQLPYQIHQVNIGKGEQFSPEYIAINPNSKIPAIIDRDSDMTVFESGAILIYLAEKAGKFLPTDTIERFKVIEWLMFQMASIGPMFGQLGHFRNASTEGLEYSVERYRKEALRLLKVLDNQLSVTPFIAGDYSIADIATYPWVAIIDSPYMEIPLAEFNNVKRWRDELSKRPAVETGMAILSPKFRSEFGVVA